MFSRYVGFETSVAASDAPRGQVAAAWALSRVEKMTIADPPSGDASAA